MWVIVQLGNTGTITKTSLGVVVSVFKNSKNQISSCSAMYHLVAMIPVTDRNVNINEPFTVTGLILHLRVLNSVPRCTLLKPAGDKHVPVVHTLQPFYWSRPQIHASNTEDRGD